YPVEQLGGTPTLVQRDGPPHELRLAAFPVGWDDQTLRYLVGDLRAEVLTHQMQQHVEAGCGAGGREHLSLIDVQRIGLDANAGIARGEALDILPMGRRSLAFENTRGREHEHTGTDRAQTCAAII